MSHSIPIILIHKGNQEYLRYCLLQVKKTNPNSRIILIGDELNKNCVDFIEHYNIDELNCPQIEEFFRVYKHFSPNSYWFESFCLLRWFYLRNLMKKLNIEKCFHIDSDVMVYCDIDEECEKLSDYWLSVDSPSFDLNSSPHSMWIGRYDVLDNFCSYVVDSYKNEEVVSQFENIYKQNFESGNFQGISDMNLWIFYAQTLERDKIFNMAYIIDGYKFDHNLIAEDIFERYGTIKKIKFINGIPYSKYIADGEYHNQLIKFKTLHFQGISKCYIKEAYKYHRITNISLIKYKIGREFKRIMKNLVKV